MQFEIAPVEVEHLLDIDEVEPFDIGQFGLPEPGGVKVVSLAYLIGQKLHACTEMLDEGKENDRARDLMDLLLARRLLERQELARVREVCTGIFENRKKHGWPPDVIVYASWPSVYSRIAAEEDFPITEVWEAAEQVREFIAEIDAAGP